MKNFARAKALHDDEVRPGPNRKTVSRQDYEALKHELEEKERALAEQAVALAILRKKQMGVRGRDRRSVAKGTTENRDPCDD